MIPQYFEVRLSCFVTHRGLISAPFRREANSHCGGIAACSMLVGESPAPVVVKARSLADLDMQGRESLSKWRCIKRQVEILEHCLGPVEYLALAHTGTLTHLIHRHKTTADESNDLQGTDADFDLALTFHLQCVQGFETTHHHHHQVLAVQIAEI